MSISSTGLGKHERKGSRTARRKPRQPAATPITNNADAPVWGAKAIGAVIGRTERQTYHLLESKAIKGAKKVKGIWSAIPSVLRQQWQGDARAES